MIINHLSKSVLATVLFASLTVLGITMPPIVVAQTAPEIIDRMEDVMRGESSFAEMTMTIDRPRYTRDVSMKAWSLGDDYSLILISAPARDEGTTYLKRDNEIWNYVPTIDRTLKMPPLNDVAIVDGVRFYE
jgi:outer membrane lipoprotein-sorting protein